MSRITTPMPDRFAAQVTPVTEAPCLLWTGSLDRDGYGVIASPRVDGKKRQWRAHIYAWTLAHGPVPPSFMVLHHCDIRCCVNAFGCLFLGTHRDNTVDMVNKGRSLSGSKNPSAKLREVDVREIRRLRAEGILRSVVADQFAVSVGLIKAITAGTVWRNVE
jgi:hypothetical protein